MSVYSADLGLDDTLVRPSQHAGNIWSLLGYVECCERSGDTDRLNSIKAELNNAKAIADSSITVSLFLPNKKQLTIKIILFGYLCLACLSE